VEYLDKLAETAVKEAIQSLAANGKRANSRNVPAEAQQLLRQQGRGRVSEADAQKRVSQAIERLRERKEIKAPRAPYNDWGVMDYRSPAAKEAAKEQS
jgi:hypothetical protein